MNVLFLLIMAIAVYLSLGKSFFSNLFSGLFEAMLGENVEHWTREELEDKLRREYGDGFQPMNLEQAHRFAQIDADEYEKDWVNYHENILSAMFWGGATNQELDNYRYEYLEKPDTQTKAVGTYYKEWDL